jgi:broad specificity phosphatase PhoE
MEIILNESFKEMNFGIWEDMKRSEANEMYTVQNYNLWNKPELQDK